MKKNKYILITGLILFSGCSQTDTENTTSDQNIIQEAPSNPSIVVSGNDTATLPDIVNSDASTPERITTSSGNLNPAHGQPGHRCDIPVGSPLNSPPSNSATQNPSPVNITQSPSSIPVKTAPGMNPPHGEPGHDCAIPVGSPLKKAK